VFSDKDLNSSGIYSSAEGSDDRVSRPALGIQDSKSHALESRQFLIPGDYVYDKLAITEHDLRGIPILKRGFAEFLLAGKNLSDEELTQRVVTLLSNSSGHELEQYKADLASYLHGYLIIAKRIGLIGGVLTAEGACPGQVGGSLGANEDAGQYLSGSYERSGERGVQLAHGANVNSYLDDEVHRSLADFTRAQLTRHDLPADLLIFVNGYTSGEHEGVFRVSVQKGSSKGDQSSLIVAEREQLIESPEDRQEMLRKIAAIAALHQTGLWLAERLGKQEIRLRLSHPHNLKHREEFGFEFLDEIREQTATLNMRLAAKCVRILQLMNRGSLVVGESLTAGRLMEHLAAPPGAGRVVPEGLVFYGTEMKQAFSGVSSDLLRPDQIGSVETALSLAYGLLEHSALRPSLALTTTGWSNAAKTRGVEHDFFSVGCVSRLGRRERVYSAEVKVEISRGFPNSKAKKELTQELAAATSLYVLARSLMSHGQRIREELDSDTIALRKHLFHCQIMHTEERKQLYLR